MAEFLTDIETLRQRARAEISKGPITEAYGADRDPQVRAAALRSASAADPEGFVTILSGLDPDPDWRARTALASLPEKRTPNEKDWEKLSRSWRPRIEYQIRMLERLRDRLDGCIGCGCLSLRHCRLLNPDDLAAERGPGPRYVLDDLDP